MNQDEQHAFTERNIGFLSEAEQQKLAESTVLVAGLGGVGGAMALSLARLGVGHLILADFDAYTRSNLNRQEPSTEKVLGQKKLDVVVAQAKDINPALKITPVSEGVTLENVDALQRESDLCISSMDSSMTLFFMQALKRNKRVGLWCSPILDSVILNYFPVDGHYLSDVYPYTYGDDHDLNEMRYVAFLETVLGRPIFEQDYFSVISPGIHTAVGFLGYQAVRILTGRKIVVPAFPSGVRCNVKTLKVRYTMGWLRPLFFLVKRVPLFQKAIQICVKHCMLPHMQK